MDTDGWRASLPAEEFAVFYTIREEEKWLQAYLGEMYLLQKFHFAHVMFAVYCLNHPKISKLGKSLTLNYGTEWKLDILALMLL